MSEAYWIGGLNNQNESSAWLTHLFSQVRANPSWVDEIQWLGSMNAHNTGLFEVLGQPPTCFQWANTPGMDHLLLQNATRCLMVVDRQTIILGQPGAACYLAAPQAVGRYNLLPRARLAERMAINPTEGRNKISWQQLVGQVKSLEVPKSGPLWLAAPPDFKLDMDEADSEIVMQLLETTSGSAIPLLNDLVITLEINKAPLGLLITHTPGHPIMITWIERI